MKQGRSEMRPTLLTQLASWEPERQTNMSIVQQPTLNRQRKGQPCALCGRLSETGKSVAVIGWVGPTCYHRVAALEQCLERLDLKQFLDGPIQFTPVESEDADGISMWVWPMYIEPMKRRAEKLGFLFEWSWPRVDGPATCWLRLPRNPERRRKVFIRLEHAQMATA